MLPFESLLGKLEQYQLWQSVLTTVCFLILLLIALYCRTWRYLTDKEVMWRSLVFIPISCVLAALLLFAQDIPQSQANQYVMTRDKTHVYFKSKTKYLKSATFDVIGPKDNYLYVEYEGDTYKIPQNKFK